MSGLQLPDGSPVVDADALPQAPIDDPQAVAMTRIAMLLKRLDFTARKLHAVWYTERMKDFDAALGGLIADNTNPHTTEAFEECPSEVCRMNRKALADATVAH